jgi:hypothetical protein
LEEIEWPKSLLCALKFFLSGISRAPQEHQQAAQNA